MPLELDLSVDFFELPSVRWLVLLVGCTLLPLSQLLIAKHIYALLDRQQD